MLEGKAWSAQSSTHSRLQPERVGNLRMLGTRGGGQAFGEEEAGPGHRTQAGRALRTQAAGRTWGAHLPSLAVVTGPTRTDQARGPPSLLAARQWAAGSSGGHGPADSAAQPGGGSSPAFTLLTWMPQFLKLLVGGRMRPQRLPKSRPGLLMGWAVHHRPPWGHALPPGTTASEGGLVLATVALPMGPITCTPDPAQPAGSPRWAAGAADQDRTRENQFHFPRLNAPLVAWAGHGELKDQPTALEAWQAVTIFLVTSTWLQERA